MPELTTTVDPADIIFRPMTRNDLNAVLLIENDCFQSDAWPRAEFEFLFVTMKSPGKVATYEGQVIAYIVWEPERRNTMEIDKIAVSGAFRRKGIARRLLIEAMAEAASSGLTKAQLEVRINNDAAISCYENLGFSNAHIIFDYYGEGEDAWLMECQLNMPSPPARAASQSPNANQHSGGVFTKVIANFFRFLLV